jgi:hypothetical protein
MVDEVAQTETQENPLGGKAGTSLHLVAKDGEGHVTFEGDV